MILLRHHTILVDMVVGANIQTHSEEEDEEEIKDPIVAPHMNADAYRNDTTGTLTQSYWDYIRFHSDGTLLIGCSELTGRYWDGGAIVGTLPEPGEDISTSTNRLITANSGTADGFFVENSNRIVLCEDSGAISVWSCTDDVWKLWHCEISVAEHDDAIMAADLISNKEFVSAAADGDIKVWDIENMMSKRNYKGAHSMAINDVAVQPKSSTTFATVSLDQYVSLWNDDISKPICDVLKNNCGLRCIKWLDEFKLVFGDDAGVLRLVDIRNPEAALLLTEFPAAVHRITIHPESKNIAVCCDNKIVTVCDISGEDKCNIIYQNCDKHTNYARGCAWHLSDKHVLYSVGYDGDLRTHNIAQN